MDTSSEQLIIGSALPSGTMEHEGAVWRICKITPKVAEKLLAFNRRNRKLRQRHVTTLQNEIKEKRWAVDGNAIRFDWNGDLMDGQHRLNSVVRSGVAIITTVVTGLDPDLYKIIDSGHMNRSAGDFLAAIGKTNSARLAAGVTLLHRYLNGQVLSYPPVTNGQVAEWVEKYPDFEEHMQRWTKGKQLIPSSVMDACYYLFSKSDLDIANEFVDKIGHGIGDFAKGDPFTALRDRLYKAQLSSLNMRKEMKFAMAIKAFNAALEGRRMFKIGWRREESFPQVQKPKKAHPELRVV